MHHQKGFAAIHVILLFILGLAIVTGYVFYKKSADKKFNAESYSDLQNLATKFNDKMDIAQSVPRIGLGSVLNDLATIKSDISTATVSPCLEPAKESLSSYADAKLRFMSDFAADNIDKDDPESFAKYVESAQIKQSEYIQNMEECKPK